MTAAPQFQPAPTIPVSVRCRQAGRIRGTEPSYGYPAAALSAIRRPPRPRSPGPWNSGNTLAIKRLANRRHVGQTGGVAVYSYRYLDPRTGRWASRDRIGERGGLNLYGFVRNDGVDRWDFLGFWTQVYRDHENWATTCAGQDDTWAGLANMLHLEQQEVDKWVGNFGLADFFRPVPGKVYLVPNTVFMYGTKLRSYESITFFGDNIFTYLETLFDRKERFFKAAGYNVKRVIHGDSEARWKQGWKEDGIYMFLSSTHGAQGYIMPETNGPGIGVGPNDVAPLYKFALVYLFACESAETSVARFPDVDINQWKDLVSRGGHFWGYHCQPRVGTVSSSGVLDHGTGKGIK